MTNLGSKWGPKSIKIVNKITLIFVNEKGRNNPSSGMPGGDVRTPLIIGF